MTGLNLDIKDPITSMGILNICYLWILLRKMVIYLVGRKCHLHGFFAVKVDEVTSK